MRDDQQIQVVAQRAQSTKVGQKSEIVKRGGEIYLIFYPAHHSSFRFFILQLATATARRFLVPRSFYRHRVFRHQTTAEKRISICLAIKSDNFIYQNDKKQIMFAQQQFVNQIEGGSMHTFTFSTELVSRIVRTLACGCLAVFFPPDSTEHCSTSCSLFPPIDCKDIETRIREQLCCDSSKVTLSATFTVPARAFAAEPCLMGFFPCYVTGTSSVSPGSATYTWAEQTCTIAIS